MTLPSSEGTARRRLTHLAAAPDPVTPAGRKQQLAEMLQLSVSLREAQHAAVVATATARKDQAMTRWAQTPTPAGKNAGRGRARSREPAHREALKKVAWLLRRGMPYGLSVEDLAHDRLTPKQTDELLDLTQRAIKGGGEFSANDAERWHDLLEKACDKPGAIAWVNEHLVNIDGRWEKKEVKDDGDNG